MPCSLPVKYLLIFFLIVASLPAYAQKVHNFAGQTPPHFIPNKGQVTDTKGKVREDIQFYWKGQEKAIFFRETGVSYVFYEHKQDSLKVSEATLEEEKRDGKIKSYRMDVRFMGAETNPEISGKGKIATRYNYYYPHCADGITNVRGYRKIVYRNLYPGIDMVYYFVPGDDGRLSLKYDFVVRPGGDYQDIKLAYDGAKQLFVDENGNLTAQTPLGKIIEQAPVVLQNGKEKPCRFSLEGNRLSFKVEDIDPSQKYTIDPLIRDWATILGGGGSESGQDLTTDKAGNVYLTGQSSSSGFPVTTGAYQTVHGGNQDLFIAKFDSSGNRIWITFYGGNNRDIGNAITIEKDFDHIYLTGNTKGNNFPVSTNAFQSNYAGGNSDAFVLKFDTSGSRKWATFFGGNLGGEAGRDIIVNKPEDAYIVGTTNGSNFPISSNPFQDSLATTGNTTFPNNDVFLAKFDSSGQRNWSTYFGGVENESGLSIDLKSNGRLVFSGYTTSNDLPVTANAFQDTFSHPNSLGGDGFIAEFDTAGNQKWTTYFGGSQGNENDMRVACGDQKQIFVGTDGVGNDMPITGNSYDTTESDFYLGRLDSTYNLIWSTYFGGDEFANFEDLVWGDNKIFFTGYTNAIFGSTYPTSTHSFQTVFGSGSYDVALTALKGNGDLSFSTYYGSSKYERGIGIAYDSYNNSVYVIGNADYGYNNSDSFPTTPGAFQTSGQGGYDAFLLRFKECLFDTEIAADTSTLHCPGDSILLEADSLYNAAYTWSNGDTTQKTWVYEAGEYWVQVIDTAGCAGYDTVNIKKVPDSLNKPVSSFYPTVTQTSKTSGAVKLQWDTVSNNPYTEFLRLYYRHPDSAGYSLLKDSIALSDTQYTHTGLNTRNKVYRYYLTRYFTCGEEADSVTIHQTLNLQFSLGQLTHYLNWNNFKGWDSLEYLLQEYRNNKWVNTDTLPASDTSLTKFPAPCNYHLTYRLAAKNSLGRYSYSDTVSIQAIDSINPDAPTLTNVSVIDSQRTAVTFNPADSQDIFRFDIRRLADSQSTLAGTVLFDSAGTPHQFTDSGYLTRKLNCYSVNSIDTCYNVSPSDTFCLTHLRGSPRNLANYLHWKPFSGYPIDRFKVLHHNGSGWDTLATLNRTDTTFIHDSLRCNIPQRYQVLALEKGGNRQTYSTPLTLTPFDTLRPAAPDMVKATVQKSDSIRITWDTSHDVDVNQYEVFYSAGVDSFQSLGMVPETHDQLQSFVQKSVNPDTAGFCYYVEAIDSCSGVHSLPSDTHCVMQLEGRAGNLANTLFWEAYTANIPVDSYRVERRKSGNWQEVGVVSGMDTSFRDSGDLRCNTAYNYRIQAQWQDDSTLVSYSDTVWLKPFDTLRPAAPDLRKATVRNSDSVEITWDTSSDIDVNQYEVFFAKRGQSFQSAGIVTQQNKPQNDFVQKTINPKAQSYCYYVEAIDSCSDVHSMPSDTHCVMRLEAEGGQRENHLAWYPYEGSKVQSYEVQRLINGSWQRIATLPGTDTSYTDDSSTACTNLYRYRVKANWQDSKAFASFSDSAAAIPFDTVNPQKPEIRAFSVQGPDSAQLTWELSNGDVKQYELQLAVGKGGSWQVRDTVGVDSSHTFGNLNTTDSQYCARLAAIDSCAANRSGFSDPHCAVQLEGTAGNLENYLRWHPYQGYSNPTYEVQKQKTSGWRTLAAETDTSFTDTNNLACHVTETYRIRTISPSGNDTAYSDTLKLTPFDTVAPPSPQLHFASATAEVQAKVEVEWNWKRNTDQKYFEVWRDTGFGNFQRLDTITYDSTYTDASANPMQTRYQYYVMATDSCAANNRSIPSDTDRIMVPEAKTGACQPENRLSWNAYDDLPQGTDYYEIYRQQSATSNTFNLLTSKLERQTFIDTNLNDTTTYCYRIKAVDTNSSYSAWTDSICKEPFHYPEPDTSDIIRSTVLETGMNNGQVQVVWEQYPKSDTFARGYYLYHSNNRKSGPYQLLANIPNLPDTTFMHKGINTAKGLHYYRVIVYNLCRETGNFRSSHRPVNLMATNRNLAVELDWFPYLGFPVQEYKVMRSRDQGPFQTVKELSNRMDTTWTDTNIRCNHRYSYKVYAYGDGKQEASVSDTVIRIGFDTIAPGRADLHKASITRTSTSNGEVRLVFDGVLQANRKGYFVYRSTGNSAFQRIDTVFTDKQSGIAFTDTRAKTQDIRLSYFMRSFDSCGNVAMPSDTHATINMEAKPQNHYNHLEWTSYKGWSDRSYIIQRRRGNDPWQTLITVDSGTLSYRDSNVTCQLVYDYRILGEEKTTAYKAFSNVDTAKAYEVTPPAPGELGAASVSESGTSDGEVEVTWQSSISPDASKYVLQRSAEGFSYQTLDTLQTTRYSDSNLNTYRENYHYRLRAIDSCGNSSDSFSKVHQTIVLRVEGRNQANRLTWNGYEGREVVNYQVLRGGRLLNNVSGDSTHFRDEQVICDSFYNYRIRAILSNNYRAYSNVDSAKPYDTKVPDDVYLRRASVSRFNDVVELKWDQSEEYDAKGYKVYRNNLNYQGFDQIATINSAGKTKYYDTFPVKDREICYNVQVIDHCGNISKFSNQGCIINPEGEALDLKNKLSWADYRMWRGGENQYQVFKQMDSNLYREIATLGDEKQTYLDDDLRDTVDRFCYYIRAEGNNPGEYSISTKICLKQEAVVYIPNSFSPGITEGINDKFGPEGLYIEDYTMKIYNRWGQRVFKTTKGEKWDGRYEGELVPQGIYSYTIITRGEDGSQEEFQGTLTVIR